MSEADDTQIVLERIDDLVKEVRRQGRASIAAQAAAESCLESVAALQVQLAQGDAPSHDQVEEADNREVLVRALLPFLDALDRTTDQARSLADDAPRPSAIARWLGVPDNAPALASIRDGTRLLLAQLEDVLAQWNVRIDRVVGVAVDPSVHRVIDTRVVEGSEEEGVVVEVARPAIYLDGGLLREADVVASRKA